MPPHGRTGNIRRPLVLLMALTCALALATISTSATVPVLRKREHRQTLTIARDHGTLLFFRRHPALARTRAGRKALRFARAELQWVTRELAETRAALRPAAYGVPASWLAGALCVHRGESTDWHISNPPYANGMQFTLSTWLSVGGAASSWASASPREQLYRAYLLWQSQGWSPWPNTSRACGLR